MWTVAIRGVLSIDTSDFTIAFPAGARLPFTQGLHRDGWRVAGPHMHGKRHPHSRSYLGACPLCLARICLGIVTPKVT